MPLPVIALADEASETKRSRLSSVTSRLRSCVSEIVPQAPRIVRTSGRQETASVITKLMEKISLKSRRIFLLDIKANKTAFILVVVYVCCWGSLRKILHGESV